jgi:hypothetical protein
MSGGRTFNMKAANLATALDKRQDRVLVRVAAMLRLIGFCELHFKYPFSFSQSAMIF